MGQVLHVRLHSHGTTTQSVVGPFWGFFVFISERHTSMDF